MHIKSIKYSYLRNLSNRIDDQSVFEVNDKSQWDSRFDQEQPRFGGPLEPKTINILCGINGSGKSTIIDAIRSLNNQECMATLGREVPKDNCTPHIYIQFDNDSGILIQLPYTALDIGNKAKSSRTVSVTKVIKNCATLDVKEMLPKFPNAGSANISEELKSLKLDHVKYWSYSDGQSKPYNFECVLKQIQPHIKLFSCVQNIANVSNGLQKPDEVNDLVKITPSDDIHPNYIQYEQLPLGWKSVFGLISFLRTLEQGDIATIEEPEVYLHPKLQRLVMTFIKAAAKKLNIQFFISTHSPTIINAASEKHTAIFHTTGHNVELIPTLSPKILNELGCRASDLLQCNGVVWVEGPSDVIYVLGWLELYAEKNELPKPKHHVDFEFYMYGGAVLSHVGEESQLVSAMSINRNAFFILDKDLEVNSRNMVNKAKENILKSYSVSANCDVWVTNEYTIENYLPDKYRSNNFETLNNGRLKVVNNRSKVKIAQTFVNDQKMVGESLKNKHLLNSVKDLYEVIIKWSS